MHPRAMRSLLPPLLAWVGLGAEGLSSSGNMYVSDFSSASMTGLRSLALNLAGRACEARVARRLVCSARA
jgi:hypothetical protein